MLKAIYRNETDRWTVYYGEQPVLEYTLDFVPREYIVAKAIEHGVIAEEPTAEQMEEVLSWFEEEIWRSKQFGRDLIRSVKEVIEELKTVKDQQPETPQQQLPPFQLPL